jgi:hypothetical protein
LYFYKSLKNYDKIQVGGCRMSFFNKYSIATYFCVLTNLIFYSVFSFGQTCQLRTRCMDRCVDEQMSSRSSGPRFDMTGCIGNCQLVDCSPNPETRNNDDYRDEALRSPPGAGAPLPQAQPATQTQPAPFNTSKCNSEKMAKQICESNQQQAGECDGWVQKYNQCVGISAQQDNNQKQICLTAISDANNTCDANKDSRMREVMSGANQLTRGLNSQGMYGGGMMAQCGAIGNLSTAANSALITYKANCSSSVNNCETACRDVNLDGEESSNATSNGRSSNGLTRCRDAKNQTAGIDQNLNGLMQSAATAQQCQQALAGSRFVNPGWAPINGSVSSGSPSALSLACKDPNSAQCQMAMKSMGLSGNTSNGFAAGANSGGGGSNIANQKSANDNVNFNLGGDDSIAGGGGAPAASETMEKIQGQSGSLPRGGGSGGSPASTGGKVSGGNANPTQLNRGYYGGNPMLQSGGNSTAPSTTGSTTMASTGNNPNSSLFGKIDLSRFLPTGIQSPVRRMAGIVGPDGIACSACQPMFIAVKSAYSRNAPSLETGP